MKKVRTKKAVEIAYNNLYTSKIKDIDKNLDNLLKAKKIASVESSASLNENKS